MKKLINILGAALLITSLTSCDSLLDMSPEDTMSPETYFSSTRELKLSRIQQASAKLRNVFVKALLWC